VKKLFVNYAGWGEQWRLGTLAEDDNDLLFEYSPEALRRGLELSPLRLPLRQQAYGDFPSYLQRLPGLIADSLPDGWGLLLMDRLFRQNGISPAHVSPLDRLAFIGDRGLGALTFEPAEDLALAKNDMMLLTLAKDTRAFIAGKEGPALRQLALIGGSPQGARPKALIYYNETKGSVSSTPKAAHRPWLIKFQGKTEHKEVCALEDLYAQLARDCGLDVPTTKYFDLDRRLAAFGTERFDVEKRFRVPIQTLAAVLHADFRLPSTIDYGTFLLVTKRLTGDDREVARAYERAVFNVVFNNRDDHSKNVSFRLNRDLLWTLAPCYDLTFAEGPGGEHQMDVCGEGREITRAHLLALAKKGDLDLAWAARSIDRILEVASRFKQQASSRAIRRTTAAYVSGAIYRNCLRLSARTR
jgi:serine/threonine-protein kinase HipA